MTEGLLSDDIVLRYVLLAASDDMDDSLVINELSGRLTDGVLSGNLFDIVLNDRSVDDVLMRGVLKPSEDIDGSLLDNEG